MDMRTEMTALLDSGLQFSIELNGRDVIVWLGDYLRQQTSALIFASFEDALQWLQQRHAVVTA